MKYFFASVPLKWKSSYLCAVVSFFVVSFNGLREIREGGVE